MDTLLDILSVVQTCGDLSANMEMGELYPTLMIRQGAGFYRCMDFFEESGEWALRGIPFIVLGWCLRRACEKIGDVRRAHRITGF